MRDYQFRNLSSDDRMKAAAKSVEMILESVGFSRGVEFSRDYYHVLKRTAALVNSMSDSNMENTWLPAAKRHKERFDKLMTQIITASMNSGLSNPVTFVGRSTIRFVDDIELIEESITPRSFWPSYRMLSYLQVTETSEQVIAVLSAVSNLFTIHKDLVLKESERLVKKAEDCIREQKDCSLQKRHGHDLVDKIMSAFWTEVKDCLNGTKVPSNEVMESFLAWVRLAKQNFKRPDLSNVLERKVSSASCGAKISGLEGTMPAFLAEPFEDDLPEVSKYSSDYDKIMGYTKPHYINHPTGLKHQVNTSVFIEHRSKPDVRQIFLLCERDADRLQGLVEVITAINNLRPSIVVKDQMKGVRDAIKSFLKKCLACYSLDLHACTNTLDRYDQKNVLRNWLEISSDYNPEEIDIITSYWIDIMSRPVTVTLPSPSLKKITYKQVTGQQMGFPTSVQMLNLSHETWVTAMIWYLCPKTKSDENFTNRYQSGKTYSEDDLPDFNLLIKEGYKIIPYRHDILGDDFFASFKRDPLFVFPRLYREFMAQLNTECNFTKGYIYNVSILGYEVPLAEFAKNLILNGMNITPLPFNALCLGNSAQARMSLLLWYKVRMEVKAYEPEFLSKWSGLTQTELVLLASSGVHTQFRPLVWGSDELPKFSSNVNRLLATVNIPLAKQTLLAKTMLEVVRDPNYIPKISDYNMVVGPYRKISRFIYNQNKGEGTKFKAILDNCELIAISMSLMSNALWDDSDTAFHNKEDFIDYIPVMAKLKIHDFHALGDLLWIISMLDIGDKKDVIPSIESLDQLQTTVGRVFSTDSTRSYRRYGEIETRLNLSFEISDVIDEHHQLVETFHVDNIDDCLKDLVSLINTRVGTTSKWDCHYDDSPLETVQHDLWDNDDPLGLNVMGI